MKQLSRLALLIVAITSLAPYQSRAAAPSEVVISHASMGTSSIPCSITL